MIQTALHKTHIYSFKYDYHHNDLCKLESRQLFEAEEKNELLFSNIKIDPSISPFIKSRFDVLLTSVSYKDLLQSIKNENIHMDDFKVEYLVLDGDSTEYPERLNKLKDVGFSIEGDPDYKNPSIIYSICKYNHIWYFGVLIKNDNTWKEHKKKPHSFSNSIAMDVAKTLVSIGSKGNKEIKLLDACCGVGTVILEACISGFNITGCDINPKSSIHTEKNLAHFDYTAKIYNEDIKDHSKKYDVAIIDLPYNLYSHSDDTNTLKIISSTAKLSDRIIIVSIVNIEPIINTAGLKVTDSCTVEKRGRSTFARTIWVCEKLK